MKYQIFLLPFLPIATAFSQQKLASTRTQDLRCSSFRPSASPLCMTKKTPISFEPPTTRSFQLEPLAAARKGKALKAVVDTASADEVADDKKLELILLGVWGVSISAFILINNFYGPFPVQMKQVPERVFFLSHMVGGMLFGSGIILTTCIERLVANSKNAPVLQFWFTKVPELDGLIVVPALTVSMVSGTGLSIVRYGGLDIAPPHVGAIFWTLIAFMAWWAATDLTTQSTALIAVNEMYEAYENGEEDLETPPVVVNRHTSNVVSCFFILLLYSMMVLKPGTLFAFPWAPWT